MSDSPNRSFIIDFGCCLPFGHHLKSVQLYREREENRGQSAFAIVCSRVESFKDIERKNIYFSLPALYTELIIYADDKKLKNFFLKIVDRILSFPFGKLTLNDFRASIAAKKTIKKHNFNQNDLIIFPSADFHGVRAFIKELRKIKKESRPRVHLRFLGILEVSNSYLSNSLLELTTLINKEHNWISVSAEVQPYADYLDSILPHTTVVAEPYPLESKEVTRSRNNDEFTVILPGTNRVDKGYFDLFHLCKEVLFEFPKVKFIIQDMKEWDKDFRKQYQRDLSRLVNVELTEAILPRNEIESLYSKADLVLLPYYPQNYHYRGSAIHYEAIVNKVPVLARKGAGFVSEINEWSSGWTYETKQELLQCIEEIQHIEPAVIDQKMDKALEKFRKASDAAINFNLP